MSVSSVVADDDRRRAVAAGVQRPAIGVVGEDDAIGAQAVDQHYRIAIDHWTGQEALAEMHYFHFKSFWHPRMKKYVEHFPAHYAKSKAFAELRRQEVASQP